MAEYIVSAKAIAEAAAEHFDCHAPLQLFRFKKSMNLREVTRCRDCRHMCEEMNCYTCYHRHPEGLMVTPNGFCDCGEPKEGE